MAATPPWGQRSGVLVGLAMAETCVALLGRDEPCRGLVLSWAFLVGLVSALCTASPTAAFSLGLALIRRAVSEA